MRQLTITEDQISIDGFANLYEALGFAEMFCRAELVKAAILTIYGGSDERL